jgi:hypothetical protein
MFVVYLALLLVLLGLLVAGALRALRLIRGVSSGRMALSAGESAAAIVALLVLCLMIFGVCAGIAALVAGS